MPEYSREWELYSQDWWSSETAARFFRIRAAGRGQPRQTAPSRRSGHRPAAARAALEQAGAGRAVAGQGRARGGRTELDGALGDVLVLRRGVIRIDHAHQTRAGEQGDLGHGEILMRSLSAVRPCGGRRAGPVAPARLVFPVRIGLLHRGIGVGMARRISLVTLFRMSAASVPSP